MGVVETGTVLSLVVTLLTTIPNSDQYAAHYYAKVVADLPAAWIATRRGAGVARKIQPRGRWANEAAQTGAESGLVSLRHDLARAGKPNSGELWVGSHRRVDRTHDADGVSVRVLYDGVTGSPEGVIGLLLS